MKQVLSEAKAHDMSSGHASMADLEIDYRITAILKHHKVPSPNKLKPKSTQPKFLYLVLNQNETSMLTPAASVPGRLLN